jgi:hypothetical protein
MSSKAKSSELLRPGVRLRLGRESVSYGRNILKQGRSGLALQHRLFLKDPWELIAEAIHRSVPNVRTRDIAHSFRRQAEDYFRAATIGREIAVQPVLLYYAFLNLSKAYAIAKGNHGLAGPAFHGISCNPKRGTIAGTPVRFDTRRQPAVFQELLHLLDGNPAIVKSSLVLGRLMPQILPGHRLWCYATNQAERFLTADFDFLHSPDDKHVWLNVWIDKNDLDLLKLTENTALSHSGLSADFELGFEQKENDLVCFQQRSPTPYVADPAEALEKINLHMRNHVWETVRIVSPYRKFYMYCSPLKERSVRLPQMLSTYLLMFFLGSVTRYSPEYFEDLFDSKYGPFFQTFISESPMQFLYLMTSDILGCEVSKPAIV